MNSRERILLIALIGVVVCGVGLLGGYYWFIVPLGEYNRRIAVLRDERDKSQEQWATFLRERKKLEVAKKKSLPTNPGDAQSEYIISYLEPLLQKSGLTDVAITHSQAVDVKAVASIPNIKKVGHQLMSFTVRARGELGQLVNVLEHLQRTPYEHRVKGLTIDRSDSSKDADPKLGISLTIETLLVAKSTNKPGRVPGSDSSLMPDGRNYADVGRKNIFAGAIPYTPPPPPSTVVEEKKSPGNIPAFVKLTHTIPEHKEAYLLNLFSRKEEIKLIADPRSGYEVQPIFDWDTNYTSCIIKVLRVDPRVVYFQARDQIYRIELGQTLEDAMKYPLSIEQLDVLDLEADREWAKVQMQDGKSTSAKKKGTNKLKR